MKGKVVTRTVLVTVLIMLLLAPFSAVWASPPQTWYWEGSGTDPAMVDCGDFLIDGEWTGWQQGTDFFDSDGNLVSSIIHFHFLGKLTNHDTGFTIRDDQNATVKIDPNSDTEMDVGLIVSLNVPGHGIVALDAGNVVWDTNTLELLREGGPHQVLHGLDVWGPDGVLCTYLAG